MAKHIPSYQNFLKILNLTLIQFLGIKIVSFQIFIFSWAKKNFPESSERESLLAEFTQYLFFKRLEDNDLQGALTLIREQVKFFKNPDNQRSKQIHVFMFSCFFSG